MATISKTTRDESLTALHELLKPGDTVYTKVNSVARSGMSRKMDLYVMIDNKPRWITRHACNLGIGNFDEGSESMRISGCGMDMGFAAVYELGSHLWPNGTPEPHGTRNGSPDTCGGYALKQRWL